MSGFLDARNEEAGMELETVPSTDSVWICALYLWNAELSRVGNLSPHRGNHSAKAQNKNTVISIFASHIDSWAF